MATHFENVYARILAVTNCQTQVELAKALDILQSSISDAKRRNVVPKEWLAAIRDFFDVNPNWILTGRGAQFLEPPKQRIESFSAEQQLASIKYLCTQTDGTRGIWKRIDENRELLECIQKCSPELLERCPWIYGWISYQDAFLMSLKGLLGLPKDPFFTSIPFLRHWEDKYDSLGMTNYLIDTCITNSGNLAGEQSNGKQ